MSISKRLYLVFSLFTAALLICGAAALLLLSQSLARFEYVQDNTIPSVADLDKVIAQAFSLHLGLIPALTADASKRAGIEAELSSSLKKLDEVIDYYGKHDISDAKDQQMTDTAKADFVNLRAALPEFMAALNAGKNDLAATMMTSEKSALGAAFKKMDSDLREQIDYNVKLGNDLRIANRSAFNTARWGMLLGFCVVLVGVGSYGLGVVRGIRRSLNGMQGIMTNVATSLDLTLRVPVARMDEIGRTAVAFNTLLEKFASVVGIVLVSADSVRTGTTEISAGNTDLSSRTEEQASSITQTASNMAHLTQTVKQNADNAQQANALAASATETAVSGNDIVQSMVVTIDKISESSNMISEITGVIEGIAFQTNILALNAAVEAARAGEQGRGFAVVATEVRSLAQRSAEAAKEIKELIGSSVSLVQDGVKQADEVGASMDRVKTSIGHVSSIVGEIAAASQEQRLGIEQVNQAVMQMEEVTQHNAALVEQSAAAAQSLDQQANKLKSTVSVFKVAVMS